MRFRRQILIGLQGMGMCAVVWAFAWAGVCAAQAAGTQQDVATVQGKVVHQPGGQGIRKVTVQLTEAEGDTPQEYTTCLLYTSPSPRDA